jgi:hypothetical protein
VKNSMKNLLITGCMLFSVLFIFQNCGTGFGNPNITEDVEMAFEAYDYKPAHKDKDDDDEAELKSQKKDKKKKKDKSQSIDSGDEGDEKENGNDNGNNGNGNGNGGSDKQFTSVTDLKICIKKIKFNGVFVGEDGEDKEIKGEVDAEINEVLLKPEGTPYDVLDLPQGIYEKIEIQLDGKPCASGRSISFTNKFGEFSYGRGIRLRYEGQILVNDDLDAIGLTVRPMVMALDKVKDDSEVKDAVEAVILYAEGKYVATCDKDDASPDPLCEELKKGKKK